MATTSNVRPPQALLPRDRAGRSRNSPLRRRLNSTSGFWLGGALLGAGGCLLGSWTPQHYLLNVTSSVLWWGIYWGSVGAAIGGLLGTWAEGAAPPSQRSDSDLASPKLLGGGPRENPEDY